MVRKTDPPATAAAPGRRSRSRDLNQLMAQGSGVLAVQQRVAMSTGIGVVLLLLPIHPLTRQSLQPRAGMARLAAALGASALPPLRCLNPAPSLEGGVEAWREPRPIRSRRLASPLAKVGQLAGKGGDWTAEKVKMLPLDSQLSLPNQDGRIAGGRSCKPVSFLMSKLVRQNHQACNLGLRCKRGSSCRQGFSRADVQAEPSRPLNGYASGCGG